MKEENLLQNAKDRGAQFMKGLAEIKNEFPWLKDVRGRGLMIGLEFDGKAKPNAAKLVGAACVKRDTLIMGCGIREVLRLMPPLTISAGEVDEALTRLRGAMKDVQ